MNFIPYVENDISQSVEMLIDVDSIMNFLIKSGHISNPTDSYAENSYDMCNIFTFLIGRQLNELCEDGELVVKEGVFDMMGNHTWLEIDNCIIDGTLTQFLPYARPLSIIDSKFEAYTSIYEYSFSDWVKYSSNIDIDIDNEINLFDSDVNLFNAEIDLFKPGNVKSSNIDFYISTDGNKILL